MLDNGGQVVEDQQGGKANVLHPVQSRMGPPAPHRTLPNSYVPPARFATSKSSTLQGAKKPSASLSPAHAMMHTSRKPGSQYSQVKVQAPNPFAHNHNQSTPRQPPRLQQQQQQTQQQQLPPQLQQQRGVLSPAHISPGNVFTQFNFPNLTLTPSTQEKSRGSSDKGPSPSHHGRLLQQQQQNLGSPQQPQQQQQGRQARQLRQPQQLQQPPPQQQDVILLLDSDNEEERRQAGGQASSAHTTTNNANANTNNSCADHINNTEKERSGGAHEDSTVPSKRARTNSPLVNPHQQLLPHQLECSEPQSLPKGGGRRIGSDHGGPSAVYQPPQPLVAINDLFPLPEISPMRNRKQLPVAELQVADIHNLGPKGSWAREEVWRGCVLPHDEQQGDVVECQHQHQQQQGGVAEHQQQQQQQQQQQPQRGVVEHQHHQQHRHHHRQQQQPQRGVVKHHQQQQHRHHHHHQQQQGGVVEHQHQQQHRHRHHHHQQQQQQQGGVVGRQLQTEHQQQQNHDQHYHLQQQHVHDLPALPYHFTHTQRELQDHPPRHTSQQALQQTHLQHGPDDQLQQGGELVESEVQDSSDLEGGMSASHEQGMGGAHESAAQGMGGEVADLGDVKGQAGGRLQGVETGSGQQGRQDGGWQGYQDGGQQGHQDEGQCRPSTQFSWAKVQPGIEHGAQLNRGQHKPAEQEARKRKEAEGVLEQQQEGLHAGQCQQLGCRFEGQQQDLVLGVQLTASQTSQQEQQRQLQREKSERYYKERAEQERMKARTFSRFDEEADEVQASLQAPESTAATAAVELGGMTSREEGTRGDRAEERKRPRRERVIEQPQHMQVVSDAMLFKGLSFMYPPNSDTTRSMQVNAIDLERVEEGAFLNDTVIDFYLRVIEQSLPPESRNRYYFFNSFLYKKLTEKQPTDAQGPGSSTPPGGLNFPQCLSSMLQGGKGSKEGASKAAASMRAHKDHERVSKWTKKVDIFAKDYLLVPIHDTLHWSLAIVCHPGAVGGRLGHELTPCILHLDSMEGGGHDSDTVCNVLRSYLYHEWAHKAKTTEGSVPFLWQQQQQQDAGGQAPRASVPFGSVRGCPHRRVNTIPRQDNLCDCGLFTLAYAEFFCHGDPISVTVQQLPAKEGTRKKGTMDAHLQEQPSLVPLQPDFLTARWFIRANVAALRPHLRYLMFKHMLEQAFNGAIAVHERSELHKRIQEYEERQAPGRPGECYLPPARYTQWVQAEAERQHAAMAKAIQERQDMELARRLEEEQQAPRRSTSVAANPLFADRQRRPAAGRSQLGSQSGTRETGYTSAAHGVGHADGDDDDDKSTSEGGSEAEEHIASLDARQETGYTSTEHGVGHADGDDDDDKSTSEGGSEAERHIASLDARQGKSNSWMPFGIGQLSGRNTITRGGRLGGKGQQGRGSGSSCGQGGQKHMAPARGGRKGSGGRQAKLPTRSSSKQRPRGGGISEITVKDRSEDDTEDDDDQDWGCGNSQSVAQLTRQRSEAVAEVQGALDKAADRKKQAAPTQKFEGAVQRMRYTLLPPPPNSRSTRTRTPVSPACNHALANLRERKEQKEQRSRLLQLQPQPQQQEQSQGSGQGQGRQQFDQKSQQQQHIRLRHHHQQQRYEGRGQQQWQFGQYDQQEQQENHHLQHLQQQEQQYSNAVRPRPTHAPAEANFTIDLTADDEGPESPGQPQHHETGGDEQANGRPVDRPCGMSQGGCQPCSGAEQDPNIITMIPAHRVKGGRSHGGADRGIEGPSFYVRGGQSRGHADQGGGAEGPSCITDQSGGAEGSSHSADHGGATEGQAGSEPGPWEVLGIHGEESAEDEGGNSGGTERADRERMRGRVDSDGSSDAELGGR